MLVKEHPTLPRARIRTDEHPDELAGKAVGRRHHRYDHAVSHCEERFSRRQYQVDPRMPGVRSVERAANHSEEVYHRPLYGLTHGYRQS